MELKRDELTGKSTKGRRIRWKETGKPGVYVGERAWYSAKFNKYYEVLMDEINFTFSIYDPLSGKTTYKHLEKLESKQNLRRAVRKKLKQLGVEMGFEIRDNRSKS